MTPTLARAIPFFPVSAGVLAGGRGPGRDLPRRGPARGLLFCRRTCGGLKKISRGFWERGA